MVNPRLLIGAELDGRYRLLDFLGTGGAGAVYSAEDLVAGRSIGKCALRILNPESRADRDAVLDGFVSMASWSHHRLVSYRGAGQVDHGPAEGFLYLVMELASGSLRQHLDRGPLGLDDVVVLAREVAEVLKALHEQDTVHRNLKPENVLRAGESWKVADLGLLRASHGKTVWAGAHLAMPHYRAPEAMRGVAGAAADMWSLGAILQECLVGALPYDGDDPVEVIAAALSGDPRVSDALPEPLGPVIRGTLLKDPVKRMDANAVLRILADHEARTRFAALNGHGLSTRQAPSRPVESQDAGLVPAESEAKRELQRLRRTLSKLQTELEQRELAHATLLAELHAFERRYMSVVGPLLRELDEIRARVAEFEALRSPEDGEAERQAAEARARAERTRQEVGEVSPVERRTFDPPPSLKKMFKRLCRMLHPDLASTDAQRKRRERFMADVNRTYEAGDLDGMEEILTEWEVSPEAVEGLAPADEVERVKRMVTRVRLRLENLEQEDELVRESDSNKLRLEVEAAEAQGRDLLQQMADALRIEADRERDRLLLNQDSAVGERDEEES